MSCSTCPDQGRCAGGCVLDRIAKAGGGLPGALLAAIAKPKGKMPRLPGGKGKAPGGGGGHGGFDEAKHQRYPKGHPKAGEFKPKAGGSGGGSATSAAPGGSATAPKLKGAPPSAAAFSASLKGASYAKHVKKMEALEALALKGDLAALKAKPFYAPHNPHKGMQTANAYQKAWIDHLESGAIAEVKETAPMVAAAVKARPKSMADLTYKGPKPGGSAAGALYTDAQGQTWLVKAYDDVAQAQTEVLANKLYKAAGVDGPDMHIIEVGGQWPGKAPQGVASKWIGEELVPANKLGWADRATAQDGFAADAWLANWDTVGMDYQNLMVGKATGKAYRIDPGGSLAFKAMGGKKPFGDVAGEWDTLRAPSNQYAHAVFGDMTEGQMVASAAKVAAVPDDVILAAVMKHGPGTTAERAALGKTLIARKADIQKRAEVLGAKPLLNDGKSPVVALPPAAIGPVSKPGTTIITPKPPASAVTAPAATTAAQTIPSPAVSAPAISAGASSVAPAVLPAKDWPSKPGLSKKSAEIAAAAEKGDLKALEEIKAGLPANTTSKYAYLQKQVDSAILATGSKGAATFAPAAGKAPTITMPKAQPVATPPAAAVAAAKPGVKGLDPNSDLATTGLFLSGSPKHKAWQEVKAYAMKGDDDAVYDLLTSGPLVGSGAAQDIGQDMLTAMGSAKTLKPIGAPMPEVAPKPAAPAPKPAAPPKPAPKVIKPDEVTSPPAITNKDPSVNAQNKAAVDLLHEKALANDIAGIKAWQAAPTVPSNTAKSYAAKLVDDLEVANGLKVKPSLPPQPKIIPSSAPGSTASATLPYVEHAAAGDAAAALKAIQGSYPVKLGDGGKAAEKLGYFVALGQQPDSAALAASMVVKPRLTYSGAKGAVSAFEDPTYIAQNRATYQALPANQRGALKSYTGSGYSEMNESFRNFDPTAEAKLVALAFNKAPEIPEGTVLSRKFSGVEAKSWVGMEGSILQEPGAVSTSLDPRVWHGSTQFRITTAPGVKGFYAGTDVRDSTSNGWSVHKNEMEIILPPNTRFMVVKVQEGVQDGEWGKHGGSQRIVDVIALPA